jgi:hypothetical protein
VPNKKVSLNLYKKDYQAIQTNCIALKMEEFHSIRVAHFVNPILLDANSELGFAQKISFESFEYALNHYRGDADIRFYSLQYKEDRVIIPSFITPLPDLDRSIQNMGTFSDTRNLPLLSDILDRMKTIDTDYYIYTNIDISLQPHFYDFVTQQIKNNIDGFMINRRRIPYPNDVDLPLSYFQSLRGQSHPGFDCFVFSRQILERIVPGNVCIGIPFIEATLAYNLIAFSNKFKLFDRELLTFHLGMEILKKHDRDLYWHNRNCFFKKILPELWSDLNIKNFPHNDRALPIKWWKWVSNPALFTIPMLRLAIRPYIKRQDIY